jgi:hypothetical protein
MNTFGAEITRDPILLKMEREIYAELAKHGDDIYTNSNFGVSVVSPEQAIKDLLQIYKQSKSTPKLSGE